MLRGVVKQPRGNDTDYTEAPLPKQMWRCGSEHVVYVKGTLNKPKTHTKPKASDQAKKQPLNKA